MDRKMFTLIAVPLLAIALAASAVAFVPGMLNAFSAGTSNATSVGAPTWKTGDTWTYNVSLAADADQVLPGEMVPQTTTAYPSAFVLGTVTETVAGSVSTDYGPAWNTTVDATLRFGEPQPLVGSQPAMGSLSMPGVSVSGFVWYRQSDLAPIYSVKTVDLERSWTVNGSTFWGLDLLANGTYSLSYRSTTQVWYHPALAIWQFPMQANESWNVSANATIRDDSTFAFMGPNVTFETNHTVTFTVPVRFAIQTGSFEDITTPAGTFRALKVSAYHRVMPEVPDADAGAMMNLTESTDLEMPHALSSAWFSSQAGNVVKAVGFLGGVDGPRVELDLVSYSYS